MARNGMWYTAAVAAAALSLGACGGSKAMAPAHGGSYKSSGDSVAAAPGSAPESAESGDYGGGGERAAGATMEPSAQHRPGLGTAWGENLYSHTRTAPFTRDSNQPFAVATLWYNDRQGANAMARWGDYRSYNEGWAPAMGGGLTVTIQSPEGRPYSGFYAGGKHYVTGEAGQRYVIVVRNRTDFRFECVASVDGLDVMDGRPAAYAKRGYLVQPRGVLEIEGFRRSASAVAAFRFSSVRGSYSSQSGKGDRNVGVVGVAFFNEAGSHPTWSDGELRRRHNADPFPQRYAQPPR